MDDDYYGCPTTRRFPRTLGEAFRDASYADPVYRPREGEGDNVNGWGGRLLAIVIGVSIASALFLGLSA